MLDPKREPQKPADTPERQALWKYALQTSHPPTHGNHPCNLPSHAINGTTTLSIPIDVDMDFALRETLRRPLAREAMDWNHNSRSTPDDPLARLLYVCLFGVS